MQEEIVLCDVDERGVAVVQLNDPSRHNILTVAMQDALIRTLGMLDNESTVRVVVLEGAGGRAFSAGGDISKPPDPNTGLQRDEPTKATVSRLWESLDSFGKPIIAKISGYCLGGGALLALKADIRICSEDSTFSIPAAKLGVGLRIDSVESVLQVLGASWTAEVLFSARRLDAREAQAAGLVSRVVSTDRLGREVDQLAFAIAANSPLAIRASKVALRELRKPLSQRDVQFVEDLVAVCRESEDHAEGKRAFAEKREPHFRGC